MKAIKIDVEKIKHCIDAYKDEHNKNPYLIMSKKTKELFPSSTTCNLNGSYNNISITANSIHVNPESISIDGKKYVPEESIGKITTWNECKIMIDDTLELGEVHIG